MFALNRRKLLEVLGKGTAAVGVGFSFLGAGCAKKEPEMGTAETTGNVPAEVTRRPGFPQQRGTPRREVKALPGPIDVGRKIIALCCGSENGNCETFIRAAAMGAEEFGVETEIIRAATLKINLLEGDTNDDVQWINEKTLLENVALICAVPCYHMRANALFYSINERMATGLRQNPWINKITRVGAVIGVGGSGYDGWACLTNLSTEIYMQHSRKIVDQVQYCFCGLREWNLWMQQGKPLTSNTHKQRVLDTDYKDTRTMWGEQVGFAEWYRMAIERAKQLGRNVAQAIDMPIEKVEYKGEAAGVECPLCHCNILLIPENLPYVGCPICWIRGTIVVENGKMKVDWNMKDLETTRLAYAGQLHHGEWLQKDGERRQKDQDVYDSIRESIFSNSKAKVITPDS